MDFLPELAIIAEKANEAKPEPEPEKPPAEKKQGRFSKFVHAIGEAIGEASDER